MTGRTGKNQTPDLHHQKANKDISNLEKKHRIKIRPIEGNAKGCLLKKLPV
jgi:hypothetical protein